MRFLIEDLTRVYGIVEAGGRRLALHAFAGLHGGGELHHDGTRGPVMFMKVNGERVVVTAEPAVLVNGELWEAEEWKELQKENDPYAQPYHF